MRSRATGRILILLAAIATGRAILADGPATPPADADLAVRAVAVLKARCHNCHGGQKTLGELDVLNRDSVLQRSTDDGATFRFVVPGKADDSRLIEVLEGDDPYMPDEPSPERDAMTPEDVATLRRWIDAGAEFPLAEGRPRVTVRALRAAIRADLLARRADERRRTRYFTLDHLFNNPTVSDRDLNVARAALSKALNSLSTERTIALPRVVDGSEGTVLAIDLDELGWTADRHWARVLQAYPYGLSYEDSADDELAEIAEDVARFADTPLPAIRADWFAAIATRPPLYHDLLGVPGTLAELEHALQLSITDNIRAERVARAGFAKSGVSAQNRMVERHDTPATPYFWISYDFLPRRARGDLVRFPTGPVYPGNPFPRTAFEHDGGEAIWSLPNGLQGYMLVLGDGRRIDVGPVDVVFDREAITGGPAIVNGISCMNCHRTGMKKAFRDEIRDSKSVAGDIRAFVREVYPERAAMDRLLEQDERRYMAAEVAATGPFLLVGEDARKAVTDFQEPVGQVARRYSRDLDPVDVACELGLAEAELLPTIDTNGDLLRFGLGTLTQKPPGTIKRDAWEALEGTSLMQDTARRLRLGTPLN